MFVCLFVSIVPSASCQCCKGFLNHMHQIILLFLHQKCINFKMRLFFIILIFSGVIHFFVLQVETLCNYHVGETVLSLQKATLIPGGSESLVYTTLSGGIGMLVPFTSREVKIPHCLLVSIKLHLYRVKHVVSSHGITGYWLEICVNDCVSWVTSILGLNYFMDTWIFLFSVLRLKNTFSFIYFNYQVGFPRHTDQFPTMAVHPHLNLSYCFFVPWSANFN